MAMMKVLKTFKAKTVAELCTALQELPPDTKIKNCGVLTKVELELLQPLTKTGKVNNGARPYLTIN